MVDSTGSLIQRDSHRSEGLVTQAEKTAATSSTSPVMSFAYKPSASQPQGDTLTLANTMSASGSPVTSFSGIHSGRAFNRASSAPVFSFGSRFARWGKGLLGLWRRRRRSGPCGPGGCRPKGPKRPDPANDPGRRPGFPGKPPGPRDSNDNPGSEPSPKDDKPAVTPDTEPKKDTDGKSHPDARRSGKISNLGDRLEKQDGYTNNTLAIGTSSEKTPSYMDMPNGKQGAAAALTEYSKQLCGAFSKGAKSLVDALQKIDGQSYFGGQLPGKPRHWHADKVGGEKLENSAFNIKDGDKNDKNKETEFIGVSGWGQDSREVTTFTESVKKLGGILKDKAGAKLTTLVKGTAQQIRQEFERIAKKAKENPEKAIRVVFNIASHGNTDNKKGKLGDGNAGTLNISKKEFQKILKDTIGDKKNVGVYAFFDCCYSGDNLA